jgi:hypothetical protein
LQKEKDVEKEKESNDLEKKDNDLQLKKRRGKREFRNETGFFSDYGRALCEGNEEDFDIINADFISISENDAVTLVSSGAFSGLFIYLHFFMCSFSCR